jgi:hypothetical protein
MPRCRENRKRRLKRRQRHERRLAEAAIPYGPSPLTALFGMFSDFQAMLASIGRAWAAAVKPMIDGIRAVMPAFVQVAQLLAETIPEQEPWRTGGEPVTVDQLRRLVADAGSDGPVYLTSEGGWRQRPSAN